MISIIFGLCGFAFSIYFVLWNPIPNQGGYLDISSLVLLAVAPLSIIFISHNFMDFFRGVRVLFSVSVQNI